MAQKIAKDNEDKYNKDNQYENEHNTSKLSKNKSASNVYFVDKDSPERIKNIYDPENQIKRIVEGNKKSLHSKGAESLSSLPTTLDLKNPFIKEVSKEQNSISNILINFHRHNKGRRNKFKKYWTCQNKTQTKI